MEECEEIVSHGGKIELLLKAWLRLGQIYSMNLDYDKAIVHLEHISKFASQQVQAHGKVKSLLQEVKIVTVKGLMLLQESHYRLKQAERLSQTIKPPEDRTRHVNQHA